MGETVFQIALWFVCLSGMLFMPVVIHILKKAWDWFNQGLSAWTNLNQRIIDWIERTK